MTYDRHKNTHLPFTEEVVISRHWVGILVCLHVIKLQMIHQCLYLLFTEGMMQEVTKLFNDFSLVLLHILKPEELDIVTPPGIPAGENMVPVVTVQLYSRLEQLCKLWEI